MPLYLYECQDCGAEISRLHKFEETPNPCDCGSNNLKKKFKEYNKDDWNYTKFKSFLGEPQIFIDMLGSI